MPWRIRKLIDMGEKPLWKYEETCHFGLFPRFENSLVLKRWNKVLRFKQNNWVKVRIRNAGFFIFIHKHMMSYIRLRYSRVKEGPEVVENMPQIGLELPTRTRNTRKAAVIIRRYPQFRILPLIRIFIIQS